MARNGGCAFSRIGALDGKRGNALILTKIFSKSSAQFPPIRMIDQGALRREITKGWAPYAVENLGAHMGLDQCSQIRGKRTAGRSSRPSKVTVNQKFPTTWVD